MLDTPPIVYAKLNNSGNEIFFAGASLDAIIKDFLAPFEVSKLVQVSESEVRDSQFFEDAKSAVLNYRQTYFLGKKGDINFYRYGYLFHHICWN